MVISLCAYCAGLVINDLADYVEDLRERPARPLPSGAVSRRTALILAIVATVFLLALILLYNLFAKRIPKFGPAVMGLCRGASVNLGISAVMPVHTTNQMLPVIVITAYICVLSAAARNETSNPRIPPLIGKLIRGLLFIQAGFCAYAGGIGWAAALLLLALWPVSRLVASRFYAS
jgi:4-hydroxybenzoate polyprenyltransferase